MCSSDLIFVSAPRHDPAALRARHRPRGGARVVDGDARSQMEHLDGSEDVEQLEPVEEDHRDRARINSSHIDDPTRSLCSGARVQVDPVAAAQRPAGQPTAVLQDPAVVLDDGGGDGIVVVAGDQDAIHAASGFCFKHS